ncbi:MAG: DNA-binding protein [Methanomassiliicoccales archaeon]|nr:MAG: DNA-binding protein [Methanomassiliicoccales archaeon]
MDSEQNAPHVKDIARALENKVSEDQIAGELENYLNVYRVPLDSAKRSIVRKYGGNPANLEVGVQKKLAELAPNEPSVSLLARVVSVNPKEIQVNGTPKKIFYGILGDDTATVPFTAWETENLRLEKGDTIRVENAYTKEFRGQVQLNFGNRTSITPESSDAVPAYQPGPVTLKPAEVKDLREGLGGVSMTVRILSIEEREVMVDGDKKFVYSGVMADKTGKAQFSAWKDFELKEGDVVKIEGGYVRMWRGIPQLSFDERAEVTISDEELPSVEDLTKSSRIWIEDLIERGGAVDATIRGILVDVKEGSGLIHRCPECRRVVRKNTCRIHGEVEGQADLRIKSVVDDGSGALTAVFGKELTEGLLGKSLEECETMARDAMTHEVVRDELADMLIAQPVEVRGNVTKDEFGIMMIVDSADMLKIDVEKEAREMLDDLEDLR